MTEIEFYQTLLDLPRPWHVARVKLDEPKGSVDVWLEHEKGVRWPCPHCGREGSVYDHLAEQTWQHLDTCHCRTYLHARLPRVNCAEHGPTTVTPPWAPEGGGLSVELECRTIDVLKECDVTSATRLTGLSWYVLWHVVERAVKRGLGRKDRRVPVNMGVDEKKFGRWHRYETIVCDLDRKTVEYVGQERRQESLEAYYAQFSEEELAGIEAIAMDMWDPYIAATRNYVPDWQKKIVFDRYHVMATVTKAVDAVRKEEYKGLAAIGDQTLKGTKYLWLWNEENVPPWRLEEFEKLQRKNLKVGRAWSIKETLRHLWEYKTIGWASRFFKKWYFWATHSRLKPVIRAGKTLKNHVENILTFAKHRITNAISEALNSKIETIKRMACGFRNREHYRAAVYFHCGGLDLYPERPSARPASTTLSGAYPQ